MTILIAIPQVCNTTIWLECATHSQFGNFILQSFLFVEKFRSPINFKTKDQINEFQFSTFLFFH